MRRKVKSNPDWSDDIIHDFCTPLKRAARSHSLPIPILNDQCEIESRSELGEGAYGVVWTTEAADCVFKLSTDATEAHFIQTAINLRKKGLADPPGIVDYRAIFSLPVKHEGYPVFAIWREQATHVGLPCSIAKSDHSMQKFVSLIQKFYTVSDAAFALAYAEQAESSEGMNRYYDWVEERVDIANEIIDGKISTHSSLFAKALAKCYRLAIEIENSGEDGHYVGNALRTYFEHGILLCDVHGDNLGIVDRSACKSLWCLTDPGHSLTLDRRMVDVEIPMLKES